MRTTATLVKCVQIIPILQQWTPTHASTALQRTARISVVRLISIYILFLKKLKLKCIIFLAAWAVKPWGISSRYVFTCSHNYHKTFGLAVCPAGFYINSNNGDACERCPVDTFSGSTDANGCQNCPSGTNTQDQTAQTSRGACGKFHLPFVNCSKFCRLESIIVTNIILRTFCYRIKHLTNPLLF